MAVTLARARSTALDLAPALAFASLTALAAQISVPLWPVPVTLQTVAVLSSGLILGARRGAAAQATYLLMGMMGLPVFAELKAGPFWLFPTGGYLLAFVLVAAVAGWAGERWRGWRLALAILGANVVLLALGTLWLSVFLGKASWMTGFVPFLPGAVAQSAAAWAMTRAFRKQEQ
jgi:biotin transport system substrate-specific component